MKRSLFLLPLFFAHSLFSQLVPTLMWENSIGGTTDDYGFFVNTTSDGGYIMVGSGTSADGDLSASFGSYDLWLTKFDNAGTAQWVKNLGGSALDAGYFVQQTPEGGYLVTGYSMSNDFQVGANYGGRDAWALKTNSLGTIQWENNYGGSADDRVYNSVKTSDGGYIMVGYTGSNDIDVGSNNGLDDVWVLKIDSAGTLLWEETYGGSSWDYGNHISETADGGFIVTAYSYSSDGDLTANSGGADVWLFKISSTGVLQWQKNYGGSNEDYCTASYETVDGGFISLNYTYSNDGDISFTHGNLENWLFKTNSLGTIQWDSAYGGSDSDGNYALIRTFDGKYAFAGYTYSSDGDISNQHGGGEADYWIVQIDTAGTIEWERCFGGTGDDEPFSMVQAPDSSFVITGLSRSTDGDITASEGGDDTWTINVRPQLVTSAGTDISYRESIVYPNPSTGIFNFRGMRPGSRIEIMDPRGQLLRKEETGKMKIDLRAMPAGVYLYRLTGDDGRISQGKLLKY